MVTKNIKQAGGEAKIEGVPRETPARNCLDKLKAALKPASGDKRAAQLVAEVVKAGYFDLPLLDQARLLIRFLVKLGEGETISAALLASDSDKIRSLGVSVHFEHCKNEIERELASLKRTSVMPGTWTQETSQSVLKNLVHHHGLAVVLPRVAGWADDTDPTVRRALAEALRPRGVWCKHITELKRDPTPIRATLERLLDDPSVYVQKAVANNLNDISKDNPDLLCKWIGDWMSDVIGKERQWIIERALRTLVKESYPAAMKLMGLGDAKKIKLAWKSSTPKEIKIGDSVAFAFVLTNDGRDSAKVRLQVVMIGPGKNNRPREAKYLLANVSLEGRAQVEVRKAVKFDHRNSVPKIPGKYRWRVLCNGREVGERESVYKGKDLRG